MKSIFKRLHMWRMALLAGAALSLSCARESAGPPNVVLVLVDTMRVHYTQPFGAERDVMPFVTELAKDSAFLPRTFSTSSWTAPATASVFTALYPWQHGVVEGFHLQVKHAGDNPDRAMAHEPTMSLHGMATERATLGERLHQLGYTTFGLASNVNIGDELGFSRGFDHFEKSTEASAEEFIDRLEEWREQIESAEHSFVYLHLNDIHGPHKRHDDYYVEPPGKLTDMDKTRARYLSEMGYLDAQLRRMYELLGRRKNTLFVLISDHGQEFGDHGDFGHGPQLHDELNRVMLLVHGPDLGVRPGRYEAVDTSLIDVLPTLMDFVGGTFNDPTDGRSLRPLVTGAKDTTELEDYLARRPALSHRRGKGEVWAAVLDHWRYIDNRGQPELYDMRADPAEQHNVFNRYPEMAERLASILRVQQEAKTMIETPLVEIEVDEALAEELKSLGYVD